MSGATDAAPVTSADGAEPLTVATSRGWLFRAADPAAPVLLLVPALGVAARSYRRFGAALRAAGLHAACIDMRGVGSSTLRASRAVDWGYLDLVDVELTGLHDRVAEQLPLAPRVLVGHSLGGQLALLQQARDPYRPAERVVLLASGSPWYRSWPPALRPVLRGFGWMTDVSCRRLGVFRGDLVSFGGTQGATLMREWARLLRSGRFGPLGGSGWDADAALASLARRVLVLHMHGDFYAPLASARHLAGMTAGALEVETFDEIGGHAPGHFRWMRQPQPVARRLAELLRAG